MVGCGCGLGRRQDGWAVDGGAGVRRAGRGTGGLLDGVPGAALLPPGVAPPRQAPQR